MCCSLMGVVETKECNMFSAVRLAELGSSALESGYCSRELENPLLSGRSGETGERCENIKVYMSLMVCYILIISRKQFSLL